MDYTSRLAVAADIPGLTVLVHAAMRELLPAVLGPAEVEASREIMGLDTQLIADGTYFVVECTGGTAGCGGWSRRETLFGGDHSGGRNARRLDPKTEPARVRAMYTHPEHVRRGVGRRILGLCEDAARAEGFTAVELAATLSGRPLYAACGYREIETIAVATSAGVRVPIIRMGKLLSE